jgi:hypothetical protein
LLGCLRFGYKAVSQSQAVNKSTTVECQRDCTSNLECNLFEWDQEQKLCRFIKKPLDGQFQIIAAVNFLIGIPDCQNIEDIWLNIKIVTEETEEPARQLDQQKNISDM